MDILTILGTVSGTGGALGAGVALYKVVSMSQSEAAKTEVEAAAQESADWGMFAERIQALVDRQDRKLTEMSDQITELQQARNEDSHYIDLLLYWIWQGLGPPPPRRGDKRPENPPRNTEKE